MAATSLHSHTILAPAIFSGNMPFVCSVQSFTTSLFYRSEKEENRRDFNRCMWVHRYYAEDLTKTDCAEGFVLEARIFCSFVLLIDCFIKTKIEISKYFELCLAGSVHFDTPSGRRVLNYSFIFTITALTPQHEIPCPNVLSCFFSLNFSAKATIADVRRMS